MLENFKMEISTDDMLRILNAGVRELGNLGLQPKLIEQGDRVVLIQYSRDAKRYTLVFESGRKVKVVKEIAVTADGQVIADQKKTV